MNKKGFTLVELITTFSLASVIIVILINIVVVIKNISSSSDVKTKLLINQATLSNKLNSKLNSNNIDYYTECDSAPVCYNFTLKDGETIDLKITSSTIKFGNYVYEIFDGVTIGESNITNYNISVVDKTANNSFLVISIPIKHKLYPDKNFGINLVYAYNSNTTTLLR